MLLSGAEYRYIPVDVSGSNHDIVMNESKVNTVFFKEILILWKSIFLNSVIYRFQSTSYLLSIAWGVAISCAKISTADKRNQVSSISIVLPW